MNLLNPEFQTSLTRAILQDHSFLKKHRNILHYNLFKDKLENEVIKYTISYFDKYNNTPSRNILIDFMSKDGFDIEDTNNKVGYLYDEKIKDITYISDSIRDFVKKTKLKDVLVNSVKLLDENKYDIIYRDVKNVITEFENEDDIGDLFWNSTKGVLQNLDVKGDYIPTGLHGIDEIISGGALRGTLNVVITPPNKGKTTFLVNIGKYAALNGFNVVHYTLELSSMITRRRYLMSMTRMSKQELKDRKRTAYDKILGLAKNITRESIIVKQYLSSSTTTKQVRSHIEQIRNRFGFIPDIAIFDYADLFKPTHRYEEKRHELAEIYSDLRSIAVDYNIAGWTASQTSKEGNKSELATINELAECFQKAAIADVIMSVNQTLEEKRSRPATARVFIAKNRDDESLITREIKTDWSRAFIGNLE